MRYLLLALVTLTLSSCAFLKFLQTPVPHQRFVPDGFGGYRVYEVP